MPSARSKGVSHIELRHWICFLLLLKFLDEVITCLLLEVAVVVAN